MLTFLAHLSFAQQYANKPLKQNNISINIGLIQFKDENLHPRVFRGLTVGSSYRHSKISRNISEYYAGLNISLTNMEYESFPSSANILVLGSYRFLFTIVRSENVSYYLGPVADLQYGTSGYFNWDDSHLYFANYLSGSIGNRIRFRMGNKSLDFNLEIPLISCISRPDSNRQYKIDEITFGGILKNLSSNPELALLNKNFYVKTGLEMYFLFKDRKTRSLGYYLKYQFMQATNGNPYQSIEHSIS
jgi:hypothetical protein